MPQATSLQVTLSEDALKFVREKVSKGEFASESDVINESLEVLKAETDERERWEREVVVPSYERFMADPSSALSLEKVEQNLAAKRRDRLKAS